MLSELDLVRGNGLVLLFWSLSSARCYYLKTYCFCFSQYSVLTLKGSLCIWILGSGDSEMLKPACLAPTHTNFLPILMWILAESRPVYAWFYVLSWCDLAGWIGECLLLSINVLSWNVNFFLRHSWKSTA